MRYLMIILATMATFSATGVVEAQEEPRVERVKFAAGTSGATIRDRITGYEVVRYLLGAQAGQQMSVRMTTANTFTYFNILQPSAPQGPAMAQGSTTSELNAFSGTLPESGDYVIEVYMFRAEARRGGVADFTLDVSIGAGSGASTVPAAGSGQAGPEFWRVTTNSSLNVRTDPSTTSRAFFKLPGGSIVRNLGCEMHEGRTWCMVPTGPSDGASIGWVAQEFLAPGSPPPDGTNAFIPSSTTAQSSDQIAEICRSTALREFGRDDLVDLQVLSARVDGVVPVNGEFSNGWRFQCEFGANGDLVSFRPTN